MKIRTLMLLCVFLFSQGCTTRISANREQEKLSWFNEGWDWKEEKEPFTSFKFETTRMIIETKDSKEIWEVIDGNNIVEGFVVRRGSQTLTAKGWIKYDEMILNLGERKWLLVMSGARAPRMRNVNVLIKVPKSLLGVGHYLGDDTSVQPVTELRRIDTTPQTDD